MALSLELKDKKPYLPPREGFFVCVQTGVFRNNNCYTTRMMKSFSVGIFIWALFFIVSTEKVQAASLYLDPPTSSLFRGDSVTMSIRLDTDEAAEECVNAVDAVLTYTENIEPVDVSIGDSIFNIWVEQPTINRADRTVTFAGGIPNGYCGRVIGDPRLTNVLAKIVFRSPGFTIGGLDAGNLAKVTFVDTSTAYLNDGRGTKAQLKTYPAEIQLHDKAGNTISNAWQDQIEADVFPPEKFSITLEKDNRAFSQKYYIVFNTSDKQTGIDHYEVIEEPISEMGAFNWGRVDAPWIVTRSPYVLKDQTLNSIIRVKAVDKAGNEYIATYVPDGSLAKITPKVRATIMFGGGLLLIVAFIAAIVVTYIRKRRRSFMNKVSQDEEESEPELMDDYEK